MEKNYGIFENYGRFKEIEEVGFDVKVEEEVVVEVKEVEEE